MINLGEVLKGDVPNSGTVREQIEYINLALIDSDPNNFYELSGIDELAENIELCGLQQPIRVRVNPDDPNRVIIVSGHRRRAAIEKLVQEGRDDLKEVPCIREVSDGSDALRELRLIYANSDTRKMSSADLSKQAERVEALLYQLKEEGYEFPGRMRDHVAEACKVSKSKLSRLKVIRDNLTPKLKKSWEKGDLNESAAYAFAQKPIEIQNKAVYLLTNRPYGESARHWREYSVEEATGYAEKLADLTCKKSGNICEHQEAMLLRLAGGSNWNAACRSGKCCAGCSELATCKKACPKLAEKIKKLRADRKAQRNHDAEVQAERDRPTINRIKAYWMRFGEARAAADISVKSWHKAMEMYYRGADGKVDAEYMKKEAGEKIKKDTTLPYGYNFYYTDADRLCKAADRLNCSVDYLLCRTDDPKGFASTSESQTPGQLMIAGWMPGGTTPAEPCEVVAVFSIGGTPVKRISLWNGSQFTFFNGTPIEQEPVKWMRLPPDEEDAT